MVLLDMGVIQPMSEEFAYAAGLVDGEGTITLYRERSPFRYPIVSIPSCTPELTEYMKHAFGGVVSSKRRSKAHHTPSKAWAIRGDAAIEFLRNIFPYLKEPEKKRRAKLILDEYKNVTPRNGRYTEELRTKKVDFERRFFENSRKI